jgi:hypothetical protein
MLYLSKTIFVYRFYKILVNEPTTEVKAESIGAPSVKEIESRISNFDCRHTAGVTGEQMMLTPTRHLILPYFHCGLFNLFEMDTGYDCGVFRST